MRWHSIFSDVDGTLINTHFEVTQQTRQALLCAMRQGLRFFIVSARSPSGITPIIRENGFGCGMIAHSGALAMDADGMVLYDRGMTQEQAREVLEELKEIRQELQTLSKFSGDPFAVSFFSYDDWIAENRSDPRIVEEEGYVKTCSTEGGPEKLAPGAPVHKIMCLCEPELLDRLEEMLKERFPGLNVVRAWENLVEIKAGGVTKAEAMLALVRRWGLPPEGTIAFGDHHNDIEMLRAAGCGVAMGNAREAVKMAADMVTADNDHDGIAMALRKLLGGAF